MDFLGLDYTRVIHDKDLFDREYKELLNRLIFSEPRASLSLYPVDVNFPLPSNKKEKSNKDGEEKKGDAKKTETSSTKSSNAKEEEKQKKVDVKGKSKRQSSNDDSDDASTTTPEKKVATEKAKSKSKMGDLIESKVSLSHTEFRRNPELELYFSLYIWTLIAVGKYLDATGLVKRYHETELFRKSPIVTQSAKAALKFNQTYVPLLINYLQEIEDSSADKEDSEGAVPEPNYQWIDKLSVPSPSSQGLSVSSYSSIYELNAAYPWADQEQGGSPNLDQVVSVALDNFQKITYERIKKFFIAIRMDTLKYFLGLPKEWELEQILQFFKNSNSIKETDEWKVQKQEEVDDDVMKDDNDDVSSVILIPPKPQEIEKGPVTKKSDFQQLINAAIHLEKKVAI